MRGVHILIMKFKDWLHSAGKRQEDAAYDLRLTQGQISRIVNSGTTNLKTAIKIREYTGGKVTVDDLLLGSAPLEVAE